MGWAAKAGDPEAIQESIAGNGVWSNFRSVNFAGAHDIIVRRTDAAADSDLWGLWIYPAHSNSLVSDKPYKGPYYLLSSIKEKHVSISEIMGYKIFIQNVDSSKTDLVGADIYTQEGALT